MRTNEQDVKEKVIENKEKRKKLNNRKKWRQKDTNKEMADTVNKL